MSIRAVLVLTLLVAMPCSAAVLPVPKRGQEKTMWCWAACGQVLTAWHVQEGASGILETSQCKQADARCATLQGATCPCPECVTGVACQQQATRCNAPGWPNLRALGFDYDDSNDSEGLALATIREDIDRRLPFLFTIQPLEKKRGKLADFGPSHMYVGVGYEDSPTGAAADTPIYVLNPRALSQDCGSSDAQQWLYSDFETERGELYRHVKDVHDIRPKAPKAGQS